MILMVYVVGVYQYITRRSPAVAETADGTAYDELIYDHLDNRTLLYVRRNLNKMVT